MKSKSIYILTASVFTLVACTEAVTTEVQSSDTVKTSAAQVEKPIKTGADPASDPDVMEAKLTKMLNQAPAGSYELDKGHGYITFSYMHQGYSRPFLRWRDWDSTLNWDPSNPENSSVSVSINTASIDTGVDKFDEHLRSADFFEVENYPTITFESTSVERTGGMNGQITGNLTVKDITQPITFDVTFNKAGEARGGGHKIGFSGKAHMLRSEWGVGKYTPFVGDEVDIIIEVEYDLPAAE